MRKKIVYSESQQLWGVCERLTAPCLVVPRSHIFNMFDFVISLHLFEMVHRNLRMAPSRWTMISGGHGSHLVVKWNHSNTPSHFVTVYRFQCFLILFTRKMLEIKHCEQNVLWGQFMFFFNLLSRRKSHISVFLESALCDFLSNKHYLKCGHTPLFCVHHGKKNKAPCSPTCKDLCPYGSGSLRAPSVCSLSDVQWSKVASLPLDDQH